MKLFNDGQRPSGKSWLGMYETDNNKSIDEAFDKYESNPPSRAATTKKMLVFCWRGQTNEHTLSKATRFGHNQRGETGRAICRQVFIWQSEIMRILRNT